MKKVFLIIAITLFSLNIFSQEKINIDDLVGYWEPSEESSQLFFWKDREGKLQVQEICGSSGKPIDLIRLKINEYSVVINTIFKPTNWVIESEYFLTEPNTLLCRISGDTNITIYYTRIK